MLGELAHRQVFLGEPVTADVDADEARWVLVRLSDPTRTADRRATGQYASLGVAVVYSCPFWLDPT